MDKKTFEALVAADAYIQPRKKLAEWEERLFLKEVQYHCPLCGKLLQSRQQKKPSQKNYQIAHIYPNSPTMEQWETLDKLERLGNTTESFENRIALCRNCHATQDYHTTKEDYLNLLNIKKHLLHSGTAEEIADSLNLENQIGSIIREIATIDSSVLTELNYNAVKIDKKFSASDTLLKTKVRGYVMVYYPYIRDLLKNLEENSNFIMESLCHQMKDCFLHLEKEYGSNYRKADIFNGIVNWLDSKTTHTSKEACEAIVSYFVQNCEVFHEIAE